MAEENITLPDISGVLYSRRSSTGKLTSSKGEEKAVPNYLRASTGSCHDFCKFGHKHSSLEKERRPFLRRGMGKPPDGHHHNDPDIQIFVPSKVRSEKNKGSLSLLSKSADCSNSDALMAASLSRRKSSVPAGMLRKSVDFTNVSKVGKNKMSPDRRLTGSFDSKLSGLIGASSSKAKIITSSREEKKKSPPTILRTSPDQSLKKGKSTSQAKLDNPSNQASRSAEVLSLSEKLGSSLKLKSGNYAGRVVSAGRSNTDLGTGQKSSKVAPLRKLQMPSPKVLLSSPKRNVSGRVARALSSPRVSLSHRSSLAGVAGLNAAKNRGGKVTSGLMKRNETEQAKTENKIKKKVASNVQHKIEDKTTKKVANKQRMNKQVKEVSPDMVQEKTLYVIKMDTEDKHLESDLNERLDGETETEISSLPDSSMKPLSIPGCSSSSSSLTNEDEDEDDDEESEYSLTDDEELDSLDVEAQKKWIRRKVVRSESQDPQPVKLRFRRGKVIEIKSENEGPRKLKFRKRRSLGKDQNAKEVERRMSYRVRGEEGEVKKGEDDSEKVVLRHQDMDGKKDGQGGLLFNNVIEETASKLAETRKSKVKALVGAFETVISLQDGKPSSGNVNL